MKFRTIATFAGLACILLFTGSAVAQGGQFVGAQWGVPGHTVDVTARVRTFIHDGMLQFEATRFVLGVDPAPHMNKVLIIRLREWDGQMKDYSYPERSVVRMELDPEDWHARREEREEHEARERREGYERHDRDDYRGEGYERREGRLEILRAYYGAGGEFVNVTDTLRSRIQDGRLFMHIDNFNLGVDPQPGVHKWLRVMYAVDGERRHVTVEEKTDLQLP